MEYNANYQNMKSLFGKKSKKKGKTIGNPPKVQQMPYKSKKEVKN